jgi:hypothetical protein
MAKENFVPVAFELWNGERQKDELGEFFRKVTAQKPRKDTAQGIYTLTAAGTVLTWSMDNRNGDKVRESLRQGLKKWNELPEDQRKPGAVKIEALGKLDIRYALPKMPPGTMVVKVYNRTVARDRDDALAVNVWTERYLGGCGHGNEAARENMWILRHEWHALTQEELKEGAKLPLPAAVAQRLARYHLLNTTAGLDKHWEKTEVRALEASLTVVSASDDRVQLRLDGKVLLATEADLKKANKGYDAALLGHIDWNQRKKTVERFDVLALGDYWYDKPGKDNPNAMVPRGRAQLGVVFELVGQPGAADLVPPERVKDGGYLLTGAD